MPRTCAFVVASNPDSAVAGRHVVREQVRSGLDAHAGGRPCRLGLVEGSPDVVDAARHRLRPDDAVHLRGRQRGAGHGRGVRRVRGRGFSQPQTGGDQRGRGDGRDGSTE